MTDRKPIGPDRADFARRLRRPDPVKPSRSAAYIRNRQVADRPDVADWKPTSKTSVTPLTKPVPAATPVSTAIPAKRHRYAKPQLVLLVMAGIVFVVGLTVSFQTLLANHSAASQISALSKKTDQTGTGDNDVPSTVKPSAKAFSQYAVSADLARYIKIPRLGVNARVTQVGIKSDGSLGTPNNVYDAAWYTGSAKPGQAGATLIDGHVSSWTTHGVFYNLKKLTTGDTIQIVRGDGVTISYRVIRSQIYDSDNVDMQAAVTPVTTGKSGLNLITCTGKVKPGTSEFNQRVIVFAEQI